eukprot:1763301-Prorocentrum_lima.AAC.1
MFGPWGGGGRWGATLPLLQQSGEGDETEGLEGVGGKMRVTPAQWETSDSLGKKEGPPPLM